jgi:hypothetical protein
VAHTTQRQQGNLPKNMIIFLIESLIFTFILFYKLPMVMDNIIFNVHA